MNKRTHTTRSYRGVRTDRLGITLIEMMVALAITTFVMLVVNQLFNSVAATVARGTQASELLQKSRAIDRQLAFETELDNGTYDAGSFPIAARYAQWKSRMVGPAGRDGLGPGGFLAIVQRVISAPLTVEDGIQSRTRLIRSDQLMFIYDQDSPLDGGNMRMHAMAPSSQYSYTGDQRDSINAEYVRMWYGHVLQIREDDDPTSIDMSASGQYADIELGSTTGVNNPSILAQDWILGRHALFLTDPKDATGASMLRPYGPSVGQGSIKISALASVSDAAGSVVLANGVCDVANLTLEDITGAGGIVSSAPNPTNYQNRILDLMFTSAPLLTAAKPLGTGNMRTWDYSPTHTYFMGGVSDFIVEFAGDLAIGRVTGVIPTASIGADGVLDLDDAGRIKWYTAMGANPDSGPGTYNTDQPITQPAPAKNTDYPPIAATVPGRANAAFVWQPEGSNGFTSWPWMLRIRYRLHDRRGDFEGREVTIGGNIELEPGIWYETIIPVNFQGL